MEQQGQQQRKKNGKHLRDSIGLHFEKDGGFKEVELQGRLVSVYGNPDGSNDWAFWVKQKPTNAKKPSTLGGGEKESARDILRRKMESQSGTYRWLSPRGTAAERAGLIAWGALLGAAIYKNLSHVFGF